MPRHAMMFATLILVAAGSSLAQADADPEEREIAELAAKPDSWVLEQVGGKRVVLDGQTLDLRMQYLLHQGREAAEAEAEKAPAPETAQPPVDYFGTPESSAAIRQGANQDWIRKTKPGPELASVRDAQAPSRNGQPIPVRIYHPKQASDRQ